MTAEQLYEAPLFVFQSFANITPSETTNRDRAWPLRERREGDGGVSLKNEVEKKKIGSKRRSCGENME